MNTNETQKMRRDEAGFLTALVTIELIILPMLGDHLGKVGGGGAMFASSVVGVVAYLLLFGERLRSRGQVKVFAAVFAGGLTLSLIIALTCCLIRSHWP